MDVIHCVISTEPVGYSTLDIFKLAEAESFTNAVHMVGTQQGHAKDGQGNDSAVAFLGWEAQPVI